jgi:hypothetical protein
MEKSKQLLFLYFFMMLIIVSCSVSQNQARSDRGWIIATMEKSKKLPFEFITIRLHYADEPTDTVKLSVLSVNGIDLSTEGSQKAIRVANGVYKIKAAAFSTSPLEVTVNKKAGYDIFVDFYMKIEPRYINVEK